jgi:transposase
MPLYRQEKQVSRMGLVLSRQTIANWTIQGTDRWLYSIYHHMHQLLLKLDIILADGTTLQVLREPGRTAITNSYLWLYRKGIEGPPIVLYDYKETRAGENPKGFLLCFKGYLQVN